MPTLKETLDKRELERSFLLRGVELDSIQGLLNDCPVLERKPDQILIEAGHSNRYLYLILSGRVRVLLEPAGEPIAILGPGEFVGELSLIDGQQTSAYVVTDEDCRFLVMKEEIMWSLVYGCPAVARNLLSVLAHRLRHGNATVGTGEQVQREFERSALVDPLTGRYNRRWLDTRLAKYMERCRNGGMSLSLLLIAADHFEGYREAHGRAAGEQALYTIAGILRSICNRVGGWDTVGGTEVVRPSEITVRCRENEFVALLPDTELGKALEVADRIRQEVNQATIDTPEQESLPSVAVSIGAAQMTSEDTSETFLSAANGALSRAKEQGGDQVCKADSLS